MRYGKPANFKWSLEAIQEKIYVCKTLREFRKKFYCAWKAAIRRDDYEQIVSGLIRISRKPYSLEEIKKEASKHTTIKSFRENNPSLYNAALKRDDYDKIVFHLDRSHNESWTFEELLEIALRYNSITSFREYNDAAYHAAARRDDYPLIIFHMKKSRISLPEKTILEAVLAIHPTAKKFMATGLNIPGKEYIKRLEVDILVKELGKAIEYDSERFHSLEGLKRGHPTWLEKDIEQYHEIKDIAFATLGIRILHIKQKEWRKSKEDCIKRCLDFLSS